MSLRALVVGLGNPGKEFARTRHNVGEEVIAELARRGDVTLKAGRDEAMTAEARVGGQRVLLAFPITYMNESGKAVAKLARRHGIREPLDIIVVHDELDLAPGVMKLKVGGGLAGHNGLRSIASHLGTQDFVRVRLGVGKPPHKDLGARHVLGKLPRAEREALDAMILTAADAVETLIVEGPDAAMRQFHGS